MHRQFPKIFTAIEVVVYVACSGGQAPVTSKEICEYQGVTLRYLEHILQQLVRHGVLKGIRGPRGGYLLARDRRKILLHDIYDALSRVREDEGGSQLRQKVVEPLIDEVECDMRKGFAEISIQDLYEKAQHNGVDVAAQSYSDFVI